jgi:UPF0755 protein
MADDHGQLTFDFFPPEEKKPPAKKKRSSKPKTTAKKDPLPQRKKVGNQKKTGSKGKGPETGRKTKEVEPPKLYHRRGYHLSATAKLRILVILMGFLLCALVVSLYLLRRPVGKADVTSINATGEVSGKIKVDIIPGMSASQVAALLVEKDVVKDGDSFLSKLSERGLTTKLRSGSFLFEKGISEKEVISRLAGEGEMRTVSVMDGFTLSQVDTYLSQRSYARDGDFLSAATAVCSGEGLSFTEGWFLSGTYEVPAKGCADALATAMHQALLDALRPLLGEATVRDYGTEAVVIIATMIQAETQNAKEMPLVSGIIYNRLHSDMPLGIDATTRYELDDWTHEIPQEVFDKETPYNTRRKKGLPPSGICVPSAVALEAAAKPTDTEAFYYLHGKDGKMHTAKSYQEHQKNIEIWL